MIWYVLTTFIVISVLLDIHTLVKSQPSFKSALKMTFNMHIVTMLTFWWLHACIVLLLMLFGVNYLRETSSDIIILTMANGMNVTITIMCFFPFILAYGMLKKKDHELMDWVTKIDKEGLWKYTDDEKKYIEQHNAEFKEKIRRWFPFIKKFDKKAV